MAPHTMKPEEGLCVVGKCTPEDNAHQTYAVHLYSTSFRILALNIIKFKKYKEF